MRSIRSSVWGAWRAAWICGFLAAPLSGAAEPANTEGPASAGEVITSFVRGQGAAMARVAEQQGMAVPRQYTELLNAAEAGDWQTTADLFNEIKTKIGQYEGSESDPALDNDLWQYALEVSGLCELAAAWGPALLDLYAREMMRSIPEGAVYFGGTDPGRFVITAYRSALDTPFHVVTQNALADARYMTYLRRTAAPGLDLPSEQDCAGAFQEYVKNVQSGRTPAGAGLTIKDGRVSVSGIQGVMAINGIISKMIFERNKDDHAFYVEESYVIPWMHPYLEPCGLIMKLNAAPRDLTPDTIARDRQYWDGFVARLEQEPSFAANEAARRTFSKLRTAIAGLYQARGRSADAEYAFKQALAMDTYNPEARFRYAEALAQRKLYDDALSVISALAEHDPANEPAARFMEWLRNQRGSTQTDRSTTTPTPPEPAPEPTPEDGAAIPQMPD